MTIESWNSKLAGRSTIQYVTRLPAHTQSILIQEI